MTRSSETILDEQERNIQNNKEILREMKKLAYEAHKEIKAGNIDIIGELLHISWVLKKKLATNISNQTIDAIYNTALKAGAIGGKITGAGGGGFLFLYCQCEKREAVRSALSPLQELPFQLEPDGTKVILNYKR